MASTSSSRSGASGWDGQLRLRTHNGDAASAQESNTALDARQANEANTSLDVRQAHEVVRGLEALGASVQQAVQIGATVGEIDDVVRRGTSPLRAARVVSIARRRAVRSLVDDYDARHRLAKLHEVGTELQRVGASGGLSIACIADYYRLLARVREARNAIEPRTGARQLLTTLVQALTFSEPVDFDVGLLYRIGVWMVALDNEDASRAELIDKLVESGMAIMPTGGLDGWRE